jgi:hypothetical protein
MEFGNSFVLSCWREALLTVLHAMRGDHAGALEGRIREGKYP